MTQPEALRLADAMLNYWDERGPDAEAVAAELRRLHEVVERKSDAIQKLWKQRDTMEAALRKALDALEHRGDARIMLERRAIAAAKQALGEQA